MAFQSLIVNNNRYLILPWVNVKNLTSKVLSMAIKQLQDDWLREYCYAPVLLESFVDTSHFAGTCYKASNLRNANKEMSTAIFFKNMQVMFPEFNTMPHADTLSRLLERIKVDEIEESMLELLETHS